MITVLWLINVLAIVFHTRNYPHEVVLYNILNKYLIYCDYMNKIFYLHFALVGVGGLKIDVLLSHFRYIMSLDQTIPQNDIFHGLGILRLINLASRWSKKLLCLSLLLLFYAIFCFLPCTNGKRETAEQKFFEVIFFCYQDKLDDLLYLIYK